MMMMTTISITLFKYWELTTHLCYLTMFLMLLLCLLIFIFILVVDSQEDPDTIDRMIEDGEAQYNKWRHPDPYIGKRYSGSSRIKISCRAQFVGVCNAEVKNTGT